MSNNNIPPTAPASPAAISLIQENNTNADHTNKLHISDFRYCMAPMVNSCDLAYRMLCRRYGATICYTEMIIPQTFIQNKNYAQSVLQFHPDDNPLVIQFACNESISLLECILQVQSHCSAIDLNFGCPTFSAQAYSYGAFLLEKEHREKILNIISTIVNDSRVKVPILAKIRILNSLQETIELCQQLRDAGCSLIAIHARTRCTKRDTPADLSIINGVKAAIQDIPIITNGNVREFNDIQRNLQYTAADGVMVAEALLDDPTLFASENKIKLKKHEIAQEYMNYLKLYPLPNELTLNEQLFLIIQHLQRICGDELNSYRLLDKLFSVKNYEEIEFLLFQLQSAIENDNLLNDHYNKKTSVRNNVIPQNDLTKLKRKWDKIRSRRNKEAHEYCEAFKDNDNRKQLKSAVEDAE